ncbi:DMT family transporter [Sphingobacterium sp. MYb382]|uniref:DMT family transporter n=1 Tax=Sphingobacterium sp. MYb382 TaxID=2745278 RepID=UPI00309BDF40
MKKSYLLLHSAVLLAGFTGVFGKLISLNEGLLSWYRVFFSALILFAILKFSKATKPISWKEKIAIGKVGLLITTHWIFFYASIKYANISIGVICFCLISFYTAIFKPLINKTKFQFSELMLSALTLLGISLIFHFDSSYQVGIILGVISSALGALYTIYNEKLVRVYESKTINFYQMVAGTITWGALMPIYLHFFPVETIIPSGTDTFYLLLLALFCTVGLYMLIAEVLRTIPAFTMNLTFNLEPIYAIILAFLFFDESKDVNTSFYIGLGLIMTSVALQTIISTRKTSKIQIT